MVVIAITIGVVVVALLPFKQSTPAVRALPVSVVVYESSWPHLHVATLPDGTRCAWRSDRSLDCDWR